ncbi:hypothetical protein A3A46_04430 [Candidatus Roizmanbacteria bacterium RIFCSPLOWO2_01_FULL_37_13]|uniref:DOT1 domain-containing protein n=1 Tax=Candidatus Roizmanbacteria bacterium RIFCSPHIGHO2_02_FULL_38_11 TaxID=1802039 RepID=A0A1F7GXL8_9BACT|nr:MAG: hypothetical protein A3C25_05640 [Candidatus Roizmanbacteria bacterium RIFCSPHIGHO2_02_FULL_38_11]OGK34187.1 MAG: hypothetical protein A3F58_00415 [Candidatus Roizmanbacteria bacterium RIFCSPHIGHO2_12_FULL_37_9b]OGK43023.1 MAG: hypothetical protein A3A46_04430 [Candidatus Roizmanbacteria bacterium RIFCSPLOWO2_01_FULL_37_13]
MVALINSFSAMIIIYSLLFIIALVVILIFSSKRFSPIPFFPTNKYDLPLIIKSLDLKNNQVIFDLGAGDGIVIFEASKEAYRKKLNTKFIAVEINPILIILLHLRHFFHPNKKNIKIILADLFTMSLRALAKQSRNYEIASLLTSFTPRNDKIIMKPRQTWLTQFNNITIYLYISPWFLDKVTKKVLKEIPKARIVSYMYPIKSLRHKEKLIKGKNFVFIYS